MQRLFLIFKKYYFFVTFFLVVFIPLHPKIPLLNVQGTYVAVRMEDFFIAMAVFGWFVINISRLKEYFAENIYRAFLLFFFVGGLSLFSGLFVTHTVELNLGLLHWLRRMEYMSLFIIAATSLTSLKQVKILTIVSIITAFIIVMYGFGQIWLNFPVISTTNKEFSKGLILFLTNGARVNSTFAGHYDLAVYLSFVLIILAGLFFSYKKVIIRVIFVLLGVLNFVLLGFTASRISFIATLIGLSGVFWLAGKKLLLVGLFVLALLAVGLIPDLRHRLVATVTVNVMGGGGPKYNPPPGTVTIFTPKKQLPKQEISPTSMSSATQSGAIAVDTVPGEPINTTELGVYRSFGIRLNVEWPRAWGAFIKNPLLGTGYSSLNIATDNDILRSLGETGLLGILSLALTFFIILKKALSFLNHQNHQNKFEKFFIISIICLIGAMFITATVIDVLEASKVAEFFWLILGSAWAVLTGYRGKSKENE